MTHKPDPDGVGNPGYQPDSPTTASEMTNEKAAALRKPFPPESIGQLPRGNVKLDYVGHAATTDRLLQVDPFWAWEPVAFDAVGLPAFDDKGGLWIRLTVCGVSRYGYGDAQGKTGNNATKEAIGDAIRNAAMRFGVALDLWSKEDLLEFDEAAKPTPKPAPKPAPKVAPPTEVVTLLSTPLDPSVGRQGLVNRVIELFEFRSAFGWPDNALTMALGKRGFESLDALTNDLGELHDFTVSAYTAARSVLGIEGVEDITSSEPVEVTA